MWRIDIHQMLRFIHEYHFHTQQRKRVLDRFSHLQPLCGITTLSLWVGKQRQILPPISHGHMPLELFENLAVVIQTSRSANIFRLGTDDNHWHDRWIRFFCSQLFGHPLHDSRFPHSSCPKDPRIAQRDCRRAKPDLMSESCSELDAPPRERAET